MNPALLEIEGFGSYLDPVQVDFDGLHLAAIVGPNGAGKSTLIDAMMWALFGETRAGDADSVVHAAAAEARVRFTFTLDGDTYRVSRVRVRNKRSAVTVEAAGDDDTWVPLSDGAVRGGTEAIEKLLGASADVLWSTTVLGQGDAGRFAEAAPADRKRLLAEILGLDRYGVLADAARDAAARQRGTVDAERQRIDELEDAVAERDALAGEVAAATEALTFAEAAVADARQLARQAHDESAEATRLSAQVRSLTSQLKRLDAAHATQRDALERQHAHTLRSVAGAEQRVRAAAAAVAEATDAADARITVGAHHDALVDQLASLDERRDNIIEAGQAAAAAAQAAAAALEVLGRQRADLVDRSTVLARAEGSCFACGQDLDGATRDQLDAHLDGERQRLDDEITATTTRRADADADRLTQRALLDEVDAERKVVADDLAVAAGRLNELTALAASLPARHDAHTHAVGERDELAAEVDAAAAEIEAHGTEDPDRAMLVEAIDSAQQATNGLQSHAEGVAAAEQAAEQAAERERTCRGALVRLQERQRVLDDAAADLRRRQGELVDTLRVADATDLCAQAFGRDGIPAMVLAVVSGELEHQANVVLGELTSGAFGVRIETRKATKTKGTPTETLEITVATDDGDRPYLALSGSERLRVDIALRVALSRVLARRSGRAVRTLVIDEGWGSLDPEGVTALVGALTTLAGAGEFDTILTITHVAEVADAFPARLVVERNGLNSSTVRLVH